MDLIFDRLKLLFEREVEIERLSDLLFGRKLHEEEIQERDEAVLPVAELSDAVWILVIDALPTLHLQQIIQTEPFTLFSVQSTHEPQDEIFSYVS